MSHAAALAYDESATEPDDAPYVVAGADRVGDTSSRRRPTAAALLRLVTRDPRFRDDLRHHALVPYGAKLVLREVCAMVAESAEAGVYRPSQFGADRVAGTIAARMEMIGADDDVASDLAQLTTLGIVVALGDGALTLPVDFERLTGRGGAAGRAAGGAAERGHDAGGRPRRGETREQARARRQHEQSTARRQTGMLLPIAGKPSPETSGFQPGFVQEVSPETSGDTGFGVPVTVQSTVAAVAAAETLMNQDNQQQQQHPSTVRAREETETSKPGVSTKREASGVSPSAQAIDLAHEAARQFRWDGNNKAAAPKIVQGYLDRGYSPAQVRAIFDDKAGVTCSGARYFEKPLESLFPEVRHGAEPGPTGIATARAVQPAGRMDASERRRAGLGLPSFRDTPAGQHLYRHQENKDG